MKPTDVKPSVSYLLCSSADQIWSSLSLLKELRGCGGAYHYTFDSFKIFPDMFEPILLLTGMISTYERCWGSARQPGYFCSGKSSQNP